MQFNINDYVKVKLTEDGHRVLFERYLKYKEMIPSLKYTSVKEDPEGYSKWQLWDLMQTFGPHISLGKELPFGVLILIDEKDNETTSRQ